MTTTSCHDDPLLAHVRSIRGFKVLDPCVLYHKLGEGAMGAVYRGRHMNLNIDVAVKCLKSGDVGLSTTAVARFKREATVTAELQDRNLVWVYDVREAQGLHYIVMEFIDGETVEDRVHRSGVMSPAAACTVGVSIAEGLAAAHARGTIHRDVKPSNVMVSRAGVVKLADLGVAKVVTPQASLMSAARSLIGTPEYMAPELFDGGEHASSASDVYAVGAVLYYMLIGRHAFDGGSLEQTMKRVCVHGFPEPAAWCSDIPACLTELIVTATAARAQDRFPSAGSLADSIRRCLGQVGGASNLAWSPTTSDGTVPPPPPTREIIAEIKKTLTGHGIPVTQSDGAIVADRFIQTMVDPTHPYVGPRPHGSAAGSNGRGNRRTQRVLGGFTLVCAVAAGVGGAFTFFHGGTLPTPPRLDKPPVSTIAREPDAPERKEVVPEKRSVQAAPPPAPPEQAALEVRPNWIAEARAQAEHHEWLACIGSLANAVIKAKASGDSAGLVSALAEANDLLGSYRKYVTAESRRELTRKGARADLDLLVQERCIGAALLLLDATTWYDEKDMISGDDLRSARDWAILAADAGSPEGCALAGDILWQSKDPHIRDRNRAVGYFTKGASSPIRNPDCAARLALCIQLFVRRDVCIAAHNATDPEHPLAYSDFPCPDESLDERALIERGFVLAQEAHRGSSRRGTWMYATYLDLKWGVDPERRDPAYYQALAVKEGYALAHSAAPSEPLSSSQPASTPGRPTTKPQPAGSGNGRDSNHDGKSGGALDLRSNHSETGFLAACSGREKDPRTGQVGDRVLQV